MSKNNYTKNIKSINKNFEKLQNGTIILFKQIAQKDLSEKIAVVVGSKQYIFNNKKITNIAISKSQEESPSWHINKFNNNITTYYSISKELSKDEIKKIFITDNLMWFLKSKKNNIKNNQNTQTIDGWIAEEYETTNILKNTGSVFCEKLNKFIPITCFTINGYDDCYCINIEIIKETQNIKTYATVFYKKSFLF